MLTALRLAGKQMQVDELIAGEFQGQWPHMAILCSDNNDMIIDQGVWSCHTPGAPACTSR